MAGTKAFLAVLDTGVVEVDIADPSLPQIGRWLKRKPFSPTAGITNISGVGLAAASTSLFVACYTGLIGVDTSQPDSLREVSFTPSGGDAMDVVVKDSLVYAACDLSGLWVIDVSNPSHPHALSNIQNGGIASRVIAGDSVAFVLNYPGGTNDTTQGLWVVDVSNTTAPRFLSHYPGIVRYTPAVAPNAIARAGNLLFVSQSYRPSNDSSHKTSESRR